MGTEKGLISNKRWDFDTDVKQKQINIGVDNESFKVLCKLFAEFVVEDLEQPRIKFVSKEARLIIWCE